MWRWLSWLTTLPQTALFWSHPLTAAQARGHSTSKCRGSREHALCEASYPAWAGGMPWWGWVLSCRLGMKLALQVLSPTLCAVSSAGIEGNGCDCCSVTLMLTALLLWQLYCSDPGCASTCAASQKDPEALGSSACDL